MHCTALHCTALHCTSCPIRLQHITTFLRLMRCTTLCSTALHCTTLFSTALHYTMSHYTALHGTTLHCTTLHCTMLHALHCITLQCPALHCLLSILGVPLVCLRNKSAHSITNSLHYSLELIFRPANQTPRIPVVLRPAPSSVASNSPAVFHRTAGRRFPFGIEPRTGGRANFSYVI
jgi:hypothetical protein